MRTVGLDTLSERLAARLKIAPSAARRSWLASLRILRAAVLAGEDVRLNKLGRLGTRAVGVKCLLHPLTGCQMTIAAHRKPWLDFTDELKDLVRARTGSVDG